jgi:hypothetical protein
MREGGFHKLPAMDQVVYGKPAAEALSDEVARLNAKRVFLIASRTHNTNTDETEKIRKALGDRYVATLDGVAQHTTPKQAADATLASTFMAGLAEGAHIRELSPLGTFDCSRKHMNTPMPVIDKTVEMSNAAEANSLCAESCKYLCGTYLCSRAALLRSYGSRTEF